MGSDTLIQMEVEVMRKITKLLLAFAIMLVLTLGLSSVLSSQASSDFIQKDPITDADYSFAVIGDTQKVLYHYPEKFTKIYDYVLDNKDEKNIQYVFGLGDITDANVKREWSHAYEQISRLNGIIPHSVIRGNHDGIIKMNGYFANDEAYMGQFDGFYVENDVCNTWRTINIGGIDYLMLTMDFGASDGILEWASGLIASHPNHNVIISTHAFLNGKTGDYVTKNDVGDSIPTYNGGYNNGDDIWEKLISKHQNIVLVLSGHLGSENGKIVVKQEEGIHGNTVTSMMINPQDLDLDLGGLGLVALLHFSEDGTKVDVEYYSTDKEAYYREENQFSFTLDVVKSTADEGAYDVSDYKGSKSEEDWTYPVKEGKIFAGWYTDKTYKTPYKATTGTAYAKFVDDNVLSVRKQYKTGTTGSSDSTNVRFLTSIDTLRFTSVGFDVTVNNVTDRMFDLEEKKAYTSILVDGQEHPENAADTFKTEQSVYFVAHSITGIPKSAFDDKFTVIPYWYTMDGTKVYGKKHAFTIQNEVTRANYIDFTDEQNWKSNFATVSGQDKCGYVDNKLLGFKSIEQAVRFVGYDTYTGVYGFNPLYEKDHYLQYADGDFVIEFYVYDREAGWGVGYEPRLTMKLSDGSNIDCMNVDHLGTYTVRIPATYILDNWDSFKNGSSGFYFQCSGSETSIDCCFTDMYFTLEKTVETPHFVDFTDEDNWSAVFATGIAGGACNCTYVESVTIDNTEIKNAVRYQGSGSTLAIHNFDPINEKQDYLKYAGGTFVLEMYVNKFTTIVESDLDVYYRMFGKDNETYVRELMGYIDGTGMCTVELPADTVLDNWDNFVNGLIEFGAVSGGNVDLDVYITGMYFEEKEDVEDPSLFIDFTDAENWTSHFATLNGQSNCAYVESATVNGTTIKNAVYFKQTAGWPGVNGFVPVYDKAHYEQYRGGEFVVEFYLSDFSIPFEGAQPEFAIKVAGQQNNVLTNIDEGTHVAKISADTILDNWDSFLNSDGSKLLFEQSGYNFTVECYFTAMYFVESDEKEVVETNKFIDFDDYYNWKLNFMNLSGQDSCLYIKSATVGDAEIKNAIRMQTSGAWNGGSGFKPINDESYYEKYRDGEFVVEFYLNSFTGSTFDIKIAGTHHTVLRNMGTGWYQARIDAALILDNWNSFTSESVSSLLFCYGGANCSVDVYFTGMYFEGQSEAKEGPDYVDFTDANYWRSNFATVNGQQFCSYVTSATVGNTEITNAVRVQASGQWPAIGGFNPVNSADYYEQYRDGQFVIEMYVNSYSSEWGAEYNPRMYVKYSEKEYEIANINHAGVYKIKLDAAEILDNWDAFANNADIFYFDDGGGNVSVDCYIYGMYFEAEEQVEESDPTLFIDFTDAENWTSHFATLNGQSDCTYVESATLNGTEIKNAIRLQQTAGWPGVNGFVPVFDKEHYEQYRGGTFVVEFYLNSFTQPWSGAPEFAIKVNGTQNNVLTDIGVGAHRATISADTILDNWESFTTQANSKLLFEFGGGTFSVDCYFTEMYFEAAEVAE